MSDVLRIREYSFLLKLKGSFLFLFVLTASLQTRRVPGSYQRDGLLPAIFTPRAFKLSDERAGFLVKNGL